MMLNTRTTPSPPPMANMSPWLLKSTVKHARLRSLIWAHGQKLLLASKILTSLLPLPPAITKSPSVLRN
jgi:hypothetical protein